MSIAPPLILLCDPHADTRTVYGIILRHHGAQVVEAGTAVAALAIARGQPFTVVVTELLFLPDGTSLPFALGTGAGTAHMPVLVVTSEIRPERLNAASTYAAAVRTKPFAPRDLARLVFPSDGTRAPGLELGDGPALKVL